MIITSPFLNPITEKAIEYVSLEYGPLFVIYKLPCGMLRDLWCDIVLIAHVGTGGKSGN